MSNRERAAYREKGPSACAIILPKGRLEIHGYNTVAPGEKDPAEIARIIREINSPENVASLFDRGTNPDVHAVIDYNNYRISHITPSARRAPISDMVALAGKEFQIGPYGLVRHSKLFDYPIDVQAQYWKEVIGIWDRYNLLRDRDFPHDSTITYFSMNSCAEITTPEEPLPQTLAVPHAMIGLLDYRDLSPPYGDNLMDVNGLSEEWELLGQLSQDGNMVRFESMMIEKARRMKADLRVEVDTRVDEHPFGYEIRMTGNNGRLFGEDIAEMMAFHHRLYTRIAPYYGAGVNGNKPHPSYRIIGTMGYCEDPEQYNDQYGIRFAIIPVMKSDAGPQESCGLRTERRNDFPEIVPVTEVRMINQTIADSMHPELVS